MYMPNEQLAGHPKFCSDVYVLGIMCLQAFTGLSFKDLPKDQQTNEYTCALAGAKVNIKINPALLFLTLHQNNRSNFNWKNLKVK